MILKRVMNLVVPTVDSRVILYGVGDILRQTDIPQITAVSVHTCHKVLILYPVSKFDIPQITAVSLHTCHKVLILYPVSKFDIAQITAVSLHTCHKVWILYPVSKFFFTICIFCLSQCSI